MTARTSPPPRPNIEARTYGTPIAKVGEGREPDERVGEVEGKQPALDREPDGEHQGEGARNIEPLGPPAEPQVAGAGDRPGREAQEDEAPWLGLRLWSAPDLGPRFAGTHDRVVYLNPAATLAADRVKYTVPLMISRALVAVAAVAAALLMTELALTRIFSVVMYYHFAFLAISIALFGLSASGVFAFLRRRSSRQDRPRRRSWRRGRSSTPRARSAPWLASSGSGSA